MVNIPVTTYQEERYVYAKDLYKVLELSPTNYSTNLKSWFSKEYLFQGHKIFTIPVQNYDYVLVADFEDEIHENSPKSIAQILGNYSTSFPTVGKGRPTDNYLIRLEFAKLIALDSTSKFKKQFVQWLLSLEAKLENNQLISRSTLFGLMEMVKLCSYIDNQLTYYKSNKEQYYVGKEPEDKWSEFDRWRNGLLKLLNEAELTEELYRLKGIRPSKKLTKIEKYAIYDSLESIRASLFDFLVTQLKLKQAKDLSSFAKELLEKAGITHIDIKPKGYTENNQLDLFRPMKDVNIDIRLISQTLKELNPPLV